MHLGIRTADCHMSRPAEPIAVPRSPRHLCRKELSPTSRTREEVVIYHHAVTKAVAQEHVRDLIAQATADRLAARPNFSWRRHLAQWARRLGRVERKVHRDAHRETSILTANRQDTPNAGGVERVEFHAHSDQNLDLQRDALSFDEMRPA
jgi:hypothetical protein